MGVKICSCPIRDKRRDEEDDGSKKKRKMDVEADSRNRGLRKANCTVTSITDMVGADIKQEVLTDGTGEYVDLQVRYLPLQTGS